MKTNNEELLKEYRRKLSDEIVCKRQLYYKKKFTCRDISIIIFISIIILFIVGLYAVNLYCIISGPMLFILYFHHVKDMKRKKFEVVRDQIKPLYRELHKLQ